MITKNITVTSKNQITIPTEFINKLQINKGRVINASIQGNKIILTPEDSLTTIMKKYWNRRNPNASMSDDDIKNATRHIAAKRASQ